MKETILYYDCFAGISGDMNLSALVGLGVPEDHLRAELGKLGLSGWELRLGPGEKHGIRGLRADVILDGEAGEPKHARDRAAAPPPANDHAHAHAHAHGHEHGTDHRHGPADGHRNLSGIKAIIEASSLGQRVKATAISIFGVLAEAESAVHGLPASEVTFHEVGAVDSIVDIVGAAICLEYLKPDVVMSSTVELGGGFVRCQHGLIPVPAPAVVELLAGARTKAGAAPYETTTPTGAAILATAVDEFSDDRRFTVLRTAYGVGHRDMDIPNLLRVHWAERDAPPKTLPRTSFDYRSAARQESRGVVLECNIDDMNPELHGHVLEALLAAGADDAWITPIVMKKSRSAMTLSALCPEAAEETVAGVMLAETSTFGLRRYEVRKTALERSVATVATSLGNVRVKSARVGERLLKAKPEYEDVRALAEAAGIPVLEAYRRVARELE